MTSPEYIGSAIFGGLCILVGIACLTWSLRRMLWLRMSGGWQRAVARVVRAGITEMSSDGGTYYVPEIEYCFETPGGSYRSSRMTLSASLAFPTLQEAHAVLAQYEVGGTLAVTYDPQNPDRCVIARRLDVSVYGVLIFGAAWLTAGILILL